MKSYCDKLLLQYDPSNAVNVNCNKLNPQKIFSGIHGRKSKIVALMHSQHIHQIMEHIMLPTDVFVQFICIYRGIYYK